MCVANSGGTGATLPPVDIRFQLLMPPAAAESSSNEGQAQDEARRVEAMKARRWTQVCLSTSELQMMHHGCRPEKRLHWDMESVSTHPVHGQSHAAVHSEEVPTWGMRGSDSNQVMSPNHPSQLHLAAQQGLLLEQISAGDQVPNRPIRPGESHFDSAETGVSIRHTPQGLLDTRVSNRSVGCVTCGASIGGQDLGCPRCQGPVHANGVCAVVSLDNRAICHSCWESLGTLTVRMATSAGETSGQVAAQMASTTIRSIGAAASGFVYGAQRSGRPPIHRDRFRLNALAPIGEPRVRPRSASEGAAPSMARDNWPTEEKLRAEPLQQDGAYVPVPDSDEEPLTALLGRIPEKDSNESVSQSQKDSAKEFLSIAGESTPAKDNKAQTGHYVAAGRLGMEQIQEAFGAISTQVEQLKQAVLELQSEMAYLRRAPQSSPLAPQSGPIATSERMGHHHVNSRRIGYSAGEHGLPTTPRREPSCAHQPNHEKVEEEESVASSEAKRALNALGSRDPLQTQRCAAAASGSRDPVLGSRDPFADGGLPTSREAGAGDYNQRPATQSRSFGALHGHTGLHGGGSRNGIVYAEEESTLQWHELRLVMDGLRPNMPKI